MLWSRTPKWQTPVRPAQVYLTLSAGQCVQLERNVSHPGYYNEQQSFDSPSSFGENQSAAAWIISSAPHIGANLALVLRYLVLYGTLLPIVWLELKRRDTRDLGWDWIALWMSWTAFALPYGRYYYCLLLLPAWMILSHRRPASTAAWSTRWPIWLGWSLPIAAWGMRSDGWYAVISGLTFALMLRERIGSENRAGSRSVEGTALSEATVPRSNPVEVLRSFREGLAIAPTSNTRYRKTPI